MHQKITIVGNGRFGNYLSAQIYSATKTLPWLLGPENTPGKDIANTDLIIFCVPIRDFKTVFESYAPFIRNGATAIDTCSVKTHPCQIMQETARLKKKVNIVGTHPLFGPQSAPNSCAGQRTAICPIRGNFTPALDFWEKVLKTTPIVCSPHTHDIQMGTQVLDHFIGRSSAAAGTQRVEMSTKTHDLFMDIQDIVIGNSPELFEDMNRFNPFAKEIRKKFLQAAQQIDKELAKLEKKKI